MPPYDPISIEPGEFPDDAKGIAERLAQRLTEAGTPASVENLPWEWNFPVVHAGPLLLPIIWQYEDTDVMTDLKDTRNRAENPAFTDATRIIPILGGPGVGAYFTEASPHALNTFGSPHTQSPRFELEITYTHLGKTLHNTILQMPQIIHASSLEHHLLSHPQRPPPYGRWLTYAIRTDTDTIEGLTTDDDYTFLTAEFVPHTLRDRQPYKHPSHPLWSVRHAEELLGPISIHQNMLYTPAFKPWEVRQSTSPHQPTQSSYHLPRSDIIRTYKNLTEQSLKGDA